MLPRILECIAENYYVLEIDSNRLFGYNTLYFDTENDSMYLAHHNGRVNRHKVRMREYVGSNLCFLEVKVKGKLNRTVKFRTQIENIDPDLSSESMDYIQRYTPYKEHDFKPIIYTGFKRITLVSKALSERITIDTDIQFRRNGDCHQLDNVVVIEQKKDIRATHSSLVDALDFLRISPHGFSKYCMGRAYLEKDLKSNNFKSKILTINKINDGKFYYSSANKSGNIWN